MARCASSRSSQSACRALPVQLRGSGVGIRLSRDGEQILQGAGYAHRHGVVDNSTDIPPGTRTDLMAPRRTGDDERDRLLCTRLVDVGTPSGPTSTPPSPGFRQDRR